MRTFAGRMKNDALKLLSELEEEKRKQVVKVMRISPATERLILENYCLAIPAGMPEE